MTPEKSYPINHCVFCWSTYNCHNNALHRHVRHYIEREKQKRIMCIHEKKSRLCANGLPVRTIQKPFFTPHKNEHQSSLYTHILEFTNNCRNEKFFNKKKSSRTVSRMWAQISNRQSFIVKYFDQFFGDLFYLKNIW